MQLDRVEKWSATTGCDDMKHMVDKCHHHTLSNAIHIQLIEVELDHPIETEYHVRSGKMEWCPSAI